VTFLYMHTWYFGCIQPICYSFLSTQPPVSENDFLILTTHVKILKSSCGHFYIVFLVCLTSVKTGFNVINYLIMYVKVGMTR
jgi:hypothetical protein